VPQVIEVGDGLAHGECRLVQIELAFEEHGQQVCGTAGAFGARDGHVFKAVAMVIFELLDACVDSREWQAV
jgi:hypothetical protein